MGWDVTREGRGLQRIVRAACGPGACRRPPPDRFPSLARMIALAILRHAETVAWSFACPTKLLLAVRAGRKTASRKVS